MNKIFSIKVKLIMIVVIIFSIIFLAVGVYAMCIILEEEFDVDIIESVFSDYKR